jgi:hypothetical protein
MLGNRPKRNTNSEMPREPNRQRSAGSHIPLGFLLGHEHSPMGPLQEGNLCPSKIP